MARDIAELGLRLDASQFQRGEATLRIFVQTGERAERQANALGSAARGLQNILASIVAGSTIIKLAQMSDEYTKFTAQLKLATLSQREFAAAYDDVRRIANAAQQDLASTGTLYARIANGTRELGLSQKQVADITETVNLALKVSGATAAEAASAQLQLSQAFASGTLRGEEFNAVNEAAPRLMKALADGIGVPIGALKKMAEQGLLTSEILAKALPASLGKLREEGDKIQTISGAFQVLKNNILELVGVNGEATGSVSTLTVIIGQLSGSLVDLQAILAVVTGEADKQKGKLEELGLVHKSVTAIFETIVVVGSNVSYILKAIGSDLGAFAASVVAAAQGDFKLAAQIAGQRKQDAAAERKAVDDLSAKVLSAAEDARRVREKKAAEESKDSAERIARMGAEGAAADQQTTAQKLAAMALIEVRQRTTGVNKQYLDDLKSLEAARTAGAIGEKEYIALVSQLAEKTYKASAAGKDAAATAKAGESAAQKQEKAYRDLVDSIQLKTAETDREARGLGPLNDAQKMMVKLNEDLRTGELKLTPAREANARAVIRVYEANLSLIESSKRAAKASEEFSTWQKKLASEQADAIRKAEDEAAANELLVQTFGMAKSAIEQMELARLQEQLAQRSSVGMTLDEIEHLEKLIAAKQRSAAAIANVEDLEEQRNLWKSIEDTAHQTFLSIADGGKSAAQRLKDTFKNIFFDWLYQMTLKKWIVNLGASISGTAGVSGIANAAGMGGTGSSALDLISVGKKIYDGFSTGFSSVGAGLGTYVSALGNLFGSSSVSAFGAGMGLTSSQAASAAAAYNSAGMSSVGSSISAGSAVGSAAGVAAGVAGGVYGGRLISGGYSAFGGSGNSAVNTGTAVGAAIGSIIPGLGTALGALVGGVIGGTVNRLFGHKAKEIVEQGITGNFTSEGFAGGQNYADWIKKGGLFRSDKKGTDISPLSAEMTKALTDGFAAVRDATLGFADTFGVSADVIDGYSKKINLVLTDDAAKNQEALTGLFTSIGDELAARVVPNISMFIKEGETASTTLQRLAADYQIVDGMLTTFGLTSKQVFGVLGVASIEARERLLALTGGVDAFATQVNYFADNFLTQAEQIAPLQKAVSEQMAALGYAGLTTSEQFKDAVLSLASSGLLATEAGAKTYAGLLAIAPQFKAVADYLKQIEDARAADELQKAADALQKLKDEASALLEGADAALSQLQRSVDAQREIVQAAYDKSMAELEASITSVSGSVEKLSNLSDLLRATLDGMSAPGQEAASRAAAQAQIRAALAIAQAGGPLPDADSLRNALSIASKSNADDFASLLDYQRDYARTAGDIAALSGLTDNQLSVAERQLLALNDQKTLLQRQYDDEMARLDQVIQTAQKQVDLLNGISSVVLSIPQALASLQAAILAARSNPITGAASGVNDAYQQYLGRDAAQNELDYWGGAKPGTDVAGQIKNSAEAQLRDLYKNLLGRDVDTSGYQYWMDLLNSGKTDIDTIAGQIKQGGEYQGLPGYANGGAHGGGWRVVGERGPELENTGPSRVYSNRASSDLFGGMEARLEAIEGVLTSGLGRLISETKRGADAVENIDEQGVAARDDTVIA